MARVVIGPDIQVLGAAVNNIIEGLGAFRLLASHILNDVGIGSLDESGNFHLDKQAWYSFGAYLRAYSRMERELGPTIIYSAGLTIPRNAIFPKGIDSLETGLRSIDVAYHMNHGRHGEALFDAATGQMKNGIGHYHARRATDRRFELICENPYPCDLDRGIVEAMARRFEPSAMVFHDTKSLCRKLGGESCTFHVEW
ncbi:MAG TPA: hypothetical protein VH083_27340 [Myxococcales bacterium]|jgi:hypothetical protein|nr:hypothetical protein [Myxococcales bacterium]